MSDEPLAPQSPLRNRILIGGLGFLGGVALTAGLIQLTGVPPFGPQPATNTPKPGPEQPAAAVPALPPGTDMATLNARETELAGKLDQLEQRIADSNGSARNAASYATQAERLMIAFSVRRAIERGQPLGSLENQLRARFGELHGEAVAAIVAAAAQPVTLEDLRLALDTIAPRLVSDPNDSLWARFRGFIGDMVVVRQAAVPSPRTSDRLRRARRALDQGDVEASLAEVAHLPGATNAESWTGAARRYLAARNGLNEIERAAVETAPAQPAPPAI
ncbi:MAG: hypothetical protein ABW023_09115 [Sphingomonas sp.]